MTCDFAHGAFKQLFRWRNFVPRRCARRMRQRNQIESVSGVAHPKFPTDNILQLFAVHKLRDRKPAYRNNQARLENFDFSIHPIRTVSNFICRRNAVGSTGRFAWKTTANSREINPRSDSGLIHAAKLLKPAKQRLPGGVRERPFQCWLAWARCLTDDDHIAEDCAAGNWSRSHPWTASALLQPGNVSIQTKLFRGRRHQRRKIDIITLNTMLMMMQVTIGK
jgi:hypothetical protein